MNQIRAFIAIELPDELKQELARLEAELRKNAPFAIKWVRPESIHLTLKFRGNIDAGTTGAITGAMAASIEGITPFRLRARGLGAFPNLKRVQVVWVGIDGELEPLRRLHHQMEQKLAPLGFTPESRPFSPHLTLARLGDRVRPEERQRLGSLIAATEFEGGSIAAKSISLMQSQLTREGAIYRRLDLIKLGLAPATEN
jgi:2'-5' RNA ligase